MKAIILVLILTFSTSAMADVNKKNLGIALGLVPVAFFHETLHHELAHMTTSFAVVPGLKVGKFAPYPCSIEGKFHFGYYYYNYPDNIRLGDNTHVAISIAPYALGTTAFVVSDILMSTGVVKTDRSSGAVLYVLGMLAPFVDFAVGFFGRSDWKEIREKSGYAFDAVGAVLIAVGAYRLVKHGVDVFSK